MFSIDNRPGIRIINPNGVYLEEFLEIEIKKMVAMGVDKAGIIAWSIEFMEVIGLDKKEC